MQAVAALNLSHKSSEQGKGTDSLAFDYIMWDDAPLTWKQLVFIGQRMQQL